MERCLRPLVQECLLRSVCYLHQFDSGLQRSVYVHGCRGLKSVMALAFQASLVPWHQNLYLYDSHNKACDEIQII